MRLNSYKVIAIHRKVDLALIDISAAAGELASWKLAPLGLAQATSDKSEGDYVFVIGHPSGGDRLLFRTFTDGKISAVRSTPEKSELQITAAINPGNSGGPVFDDEGKVIGIATYTIRKNPNDKRNLSLESLNFAVDVRHLHDLLIDPAQSFSQAEITAILQRKK